MGPNYVGEYTQCSVCSSVDVCQLLNRYLKFLAASEDFACFNSYLRILPATFVSFKYKQIFNQNTFLVEGKVHKDSSNV